MTSKARLPSAPVMLRHHTSSRLTCLSIAATTVIIFAIFQERSLLDLLTHANNGMNTNRRASLDIRATRFPSVEERVKIYMSNWYEPPCPGGGNFIEISGINVTSLAVQEITTTRQSDNEELGRTLVFKNDVIINKIFFLDRHKLWDCAYNGLGTLNGKKAGLSYCRDVQSTLLPALDRVNNGSMTPVFLQFGDIAYSYGLGPVNIPHIRKIRYATTRANLSAVTSNDCHGGPRDPLVTELDHENLQPILWKLNSPRHFAMLPEVQQNDIPWSLKINKTVFRGALTGLEMEEARQHTDFDNCMFSRRCRLVFQHDKSSLVDARLSRTIGFINETLNGVSLTGELFSMEQMLQYKAIVILEGNDVASGLKWALLSNSVVMMQPPTFTSWAMEEMLEPWIHYIPLNEELSDVEEKMQWVLDNDEQAQRIAERGSFWIQDLVFHPDASSDDQSIQEEILRRYRAHFLVNLESSNS